MISPIQINGFNKSNVKEMFRRQKKDSFTKVGIVVLSGGHISEGRVILSLIWSTIICKLMEANIVLNVLLVQY